MTLDRDKLFARIVKDAEAGFDGNDGAGNPNMTAAQVCRKRVALERQQAKVSEALALLRITCQHPTPTFQYKGSSGNYDPSDNSYWMEWHCPDCGKKWTTDKSREERLRYPGAVETKVR
jgi:hypothetical protein